MHMHCSRLTLLDVAKKQINTSPNVQLHVMCSTPMQNAAAAPLADRLRFRRPWLHIPVATTKDVLNRSSSIVALGGTSLAVLVRR